MSTRIMPHRQHYLQLCLTTSTVISTFSVTMIHSCMVFVSIFSKEEDENDLGQFVRFLSSLFNQDSYLFGSKVCLTCATATSRTKTVFCNHINGMIVYLVQIKNYFH